MAMFCVASVQPSRKFAWLVTWRKFASRALLHHCSFLFCFIQPHCFLSPTRP
uniref:Uncharacterized protein n=1 Tax=Mesocestoides corti TaxID=53468 RepID=A0A5K3F480_MESCO